MPNAFVYYFGAGHADGGRADKALLGGKGANLAEMTRIGIPVPPGFTISTEACRAFLREKKHPKALRGEVEAAVRRLEKDTGKKLGGTEHPLLVSVRSGGAVSMPGMMDTILNLGLNDTTVEALARASGEPRFAYDSYRRFIQMYSDVVLGVPQKDFEALLEGRKIIRDVEADTALEWEDLKALVVEYKILVARETGQKFPENPTDQLWGAIEAVFRSWNTDRAVAYRRLNNIPDDLGTAVSVVSMVYGNMGGDSGTGVAFTRNPSTGEKKIFGEFLINAQGEDVVAGIRTPLLIREMERALPTAYKELLQVQATLERHYREMQDIEFTVEKGRLYLLQTRIGKRAAAAAVKVAVDMVDEALITREEAVLRVDPQQLEQLLHRRLDPAAETVVLSTGLPASPGAASGQVVFSPDVAHERNAKGDAVILIRSETSPDDFHGMVAARAIVTSRGGMTSHAAVVARGMGKCCVVGAHDLEVDESRGIAIAHGRVIREGDWVTVDGTTGRILLGKVATVEPELSDQFHILMGWADAARTMKVRTNADTPADAQKAREFGAEGIGLCRTEHMFFEGDRIISMREMILAVTEQERRAALAKLLPMQRADFKGIFKAMDGLPVTIRLLDPPLHEFLPRSEEDSRHLAQILHIDEAQILHAVERHRENNPMLGLRGCRLGITYPEITQMQAQAIFEAALEAMQEGIDVQVEVMIPLVGNVKEFSRQEEVIRDMAERVLGSDTKLPYLVGTMIELPRAALTARAIAEEAEFFSFGTNDLTQTTLGISRDDAGTFLPYYIENGILPDDPFQVLDREGVGRLIEIATREGRSARPRLKIGVCGEHGGDPRSVEFFQNIGLDYVSCSPFRVPVARLAAAHAALRTKPKSSPSDSEGIRPLTPAVAGD